MAHVIIVRVVADPRRVSTPRVVAYVGVLSHATCMLPATAPLAEYPSSVPSHAWFRVWGLGIRRQDRELSGVLGEVQGSSAWGWVWGLGFKAGGVSRLEAVGRGSRERRGGGFRAQSGGQSPGGAASSSPQAHRTGQLYSRSNFVHLASAHRLLHLWVPACKGRNAS